MSGNYLDYGALGAAMLVLLVSVGVVYRVLMWSRDMAEMVLDRLQDNTHALLHMADRLSPVDDEEDA